MSAGVRSIEKFYFRLEENGRIVLVRKAQHNNGLFKQACISCIP